MHEQPQPEHAWLQKLVGEWTVEMVASMGPDQPPITHKGRERFRSLGGMWFVGESTYDMPDGAPSDMIMTLGFNAATKRYCGTFIGSMMSAMWIYDGACEGDTLTLDTEGASFSGDGSIVPYQDIIKFQGDDVRTLSSQTKGPDGTWTRFMTATYRRVK